MDQINLIEGYKSANELTTQLITLSTGVIALSITFIKDILKQNTSKAIIFLKLSWFSYLLSILFGILTMMSVSGMIFKAAKDGTSSVIGDPYGSTRFPSEIQILFFIVGTILIIWYGIKSFRSISE